MIPGELPTYNENRLLQVAHIDAPGALAVLLGVSCRVF